MKKKMIFLLLLMFGAMLLCGCRARLTKEALSKAELQDGQGAGIEIEIEYADNDESLADQSDLTRDDPEASVKQYDENARGYVLQKAEHIIHVEGEGEGLFSQDPQNGLKASKQGEYAQKSVIKEVPAGNADNKGVSPDADEADSAYSYYSVLLNERIDTLFECKRLYVYWETIKDHETIFRNSKEHNILAGAGTYDVSARLLEENLLVDDGWIARKNPDMIVKVVPGNILGANILTAKGAGNIYDSLANRPEWKSMDAVKNGKVLLVSGELLDDEILHTAAMLIIACTAYPSLFGDVVLDDAVQALFEEATGQVLAGEVYYTK